MFAPKTMTVQAAPSELSKSIAIVLSLTIALMLPAFWNRYPLIYYDTLDYVTMPFIWKMPLYRTAGYGVFGLVGRFTGSFWGTVVVQSLMVAYVMFMSIRCMAPELRLRGWIALIAGMILLTSLPWETSEVMPDTFTGAMILSAVVLAYYDAELSPLHRWSLVAIMAIAGATHPTHVALLCGMLLCFVVMNWLMRFGWFFRQAKIKIVAVGLIVSTGMLAASNWAMTGRVFLAPETTSTLTLAVLIQDGLAKRYLNDVCTEQTTERKPILCPERDKLPDDANQFLWHDQIFWDHDGWTGFMEEAPWEVGQIIRRYPLAFAWTATKLAAQQFVTMSTGEGLEPMQKFIGDAMKLYYPQEVPAFLAARQQSIPDATFLPLGAVDAIDVVVVFISLAVLLAIVWLGVKRRDKTALTIAALIFLVYLGNALLCGAVSNPAPRYGSRVGWVMVFAAALLLPRVISNRPTASR